MRPKICKGQWTKKKSLAPGTIRQPALYEGAALPIELTRRLYQDSIWSAKISNIF